MPLFIHLAWSTDGTAVPMLSFATINAPTPILRTAASTPVQRIKWNHSGDEELDVLPRAEVIPARCKFTILRLTV